ncbi:hypothetical protein DPMN_159663 [Dreissena polymorpha]|uniref:Uncharacterized protein n=1 Tax=Dreissena polymorpha TaxID=45954 RepID=A0A9D4IQW6_DREPO|nr:hypothetical protein DPMN_159663 [Dreissena polymorpha]
MDVIKTTEVFCLSGAVSKPTSVNASSKTFFADALSSPSGKDPAPKCNGNQWQAPEEVNKPNSYKQILIYLRVMKLEVRTDLANLHLKFNRMSQSINSLRTKKMLKKKTREP